MMVFNKKKFCEEETHPGSPDSNSNSLIFEKVRDAFCCGDQYSSMF
jgi:hypothetical protein